MDSRNESMFLRISYTNPASLRISNLVFRSNKIVLAAHLPGFKDRLQTQDELELGHVTTEQFSQVLELVFKGRIAVQPERRENFLKIVTELGILGLSKSDNEKFKSGEDKFKSGDESSHVVKGRQKSGGESSQTGEEKLKSDYNKSKSGKESSLVAEERQKSGGESSAKSSEAGEEKLKSDNDRSKSGEERSKSGDKRPDDDESKSGKGGSKSDDKKSESVNQKPKPGNKRLKPNDERYKSGGDRDRSGEDLESEPPKKKSKKKESLNAEDKKLNLEQNETEAPKLKKNEVVLTLSVDSNVEEVEAEPPEASVGHESLSDKETSNFGGKASNVQKMKVERSKTEKTESVRIGSRRNVEEMGAGPPESSFGIKSLPNKETEEASNVAEVDTEPLEKTVGIESLPDELLIKILSHIPTRDLLQNVALVSKRFETLSKDRGAHIVVNLDFDIVVNCEKNENEEKFELKQFLEKATFLEELHVNCVTHNQIFFNDVWKQRPPFYDFLLAIADHNFVKVVNVCSQCLPIKEKDFIQLSKTNLFRSGLLTKLVLPVREGQEKKNAKSERDEMRAAIASLSKSKNLQHLDLEPGYPDVSTLKYAELLDVALACEKIHTVKPLEDVLQSNIEKLIEARKGTLRELDLDRGVGEKEPLYSLAECTKLEKLKFTPHFDSIKILTSLESLNELRLNIPDEESFEHSIAPNSLPQISRLEVYVNSADTKNCLIALANACPNLYFLDLQFEEMPLYRCEKALQEFFLFRQVPQTGSHQLFLCNKRRRRRRHFNFE
jgi:hypothetical protein